MNLDLSTLDARQREFYREAIAKFRANVSWSDFEDFAFGAGSPLYAQRRSHLDVLNDPLYLALANMWLDLGVKQGLVAQENLGEKKKDGQRRSQSRGREAAKRRNAEKNRELAAAHSHAGTHP